uniref:E3 ubiquitin-protein ligase listerin n=1 Tax=Sciurus vulgaris TaxID=55149 RepID=A0A8D2JPD7_SCIVU
MAQNLENVLSNFWALDIVSPLRKKPLEDLVCKLAEMSINYVNEQKSEQHLRNWLPWQMVFVIRMEGLALWKNNVDKRFEGVEDCMICFSVIHGFNYSLPKKACRTCKKKFHSACLYKWFTSSNKSTCPLCRETFF